MHQVLSLIHREKCTRIGNSFFPLYTVQRKSVYVLATSSFPYIHLLTTAYFPYKHEKMLHVLVTASFPYVQETVYTYWQQLRSLIHRENNQNKYVLATSFFPCIHALTTAFSLMFMNKVKLCTYWKKLLSL